MGLNYTHLNQEPEPDYIDQFDDNEPKLGFFDHLEALRMHIIRAILVLGVGTVWAFFNKTYIFDKIILAPKNADFITWRAFCYLGKKLGVEGMCVKQFSFQLININISGQFVKHITTSMVVGLIIGFPYLIFEIWRFVAPALHQNEKKYAVKLIFYGSVLFFMGIAFGYFLLAPISIVFLGTIANGVLCDGKAWGLVAWLVATVVLPLVFGACYPFLFMQFGVAFALLMLHGACMAGWFYTKRTAAGA